MPDPPMMPSTARVMTSPSQDFAEDVRLYCGAIIKHCRAVARGLEMPTTKEREKTPVDHRCLPQHERARHQPGNVRKYQPAPRRGPADHADQHALRGDGARQIVFMHMDGSHDAAQRPSSEWRFHLDILRARPEINAVVHAHPPYSTILAIMGLEIPPIHYMIACAGGDTIRVAPYATFGTQELSEHAVRALEGRLACLLEHHGMIAVGASLSKAMWLAVEVETLARQYHGCIQIGTPRLLPKAEIENVLGRIAGYGPADK